MDSWNVIMVVLAMLVISPTSKCQTKSTVHIQGVLSLSSEVGSAKEIFSLVRCLNWTSMVIFYDDSREEYQNLVNEVEFANLKLSPIIYDVTVTQDLDSVLVDLHALYKTINVLVICREENVIRLLKVVNTIDARHNRLLDYQHRSYWLLVLPDMDVGVVQNMSSNLDNIALFTTMTREASRSRFCEFSAYPVFTICDTLCEDRYIISAHGVRSHTTWRSCLYSSLHKHNTSCLSAVFPNSQYGYNGREILVTTRESGSCSVFSQQGNKTTYSGYCFDIFKEVISSLNISFKVIPIRSSKWGHMQPNGSWYGMMGEIEKGEADIAVADITFHENRSSVLDFLLPGMGVHLEVVLYRKNMDGEHSLVSFLDPFQTSVYLVLLGVLIGVPAFYYIIERSLVSNNGTISIWDVYCYFVGGVFQQGVFINTISWSARTVVATFWLASVCLSVFYTAYLTASLTTGKNAQPFTNIEELVNNDDYKLGTKGRGPSFKTIQTATSKPLSDIWLKLVASNKTDSSVIERDFDRALDKVLNDKYAIIIGSNLARIAMSRDCRFAILKDIVVWQQFSFGIRKKSPFRDDLEKMFSRVVDSGLAKRARTTSEGDILTCEMLKGETVHISYMLGKISVLVIGAGMATVVLLVEFLIRAILRTLKKRNIHHLTKS